MFEQDTETVREVPNGASSVTLTSVTDEPVMIMTVLDPITGSMASIALGTRQALELRAALARKVRRAYGLQMKKGTTDG